MTHKSNKNINIKKDRTKSYIYIYDHFKFIGMLMWHRRKKRWVFEEAQ